jgi:hypothetical protein
MQAPGRCFLTLCLPAALTAAAMLWAMPARAQGDTPKPTTAQPGTTTQPAPNAKSFSETAPKALLVDPCKVKNPPSYCGKH